ncbi:hypothetical protein G6F43_013819 [Rhizopus delemar]|nr:hypothetical protein G6F43_013819 [Rhizopus delemar]
MADERYCVRQVTKTRRSSAAKVVKELEKDIGRKVIAVTVRRTLRKASLGAVEKPKTALPSAKNICKRLSWCMAHKDWTTVAVKIGRMFSYFAYTDYLLLHFLAYYNNIYIIRKSKL